MTTARFAAFDTALPAEASRPVDAGGGAARSSTSTADLMFTLRVTLIATVAKLGLVGYALLGQGSGIG